MDGKKEIFGSYGKLSVEYDVRTSGLATVRFELEGTSSFDHYAQLWQNGDLIGTRNGTPIYHDRESEVGELYFTEAYERITNTLLENSGTLDDVLIDALQRGVGMELRRVA